MRRIFTYSFIAIALSLVSIISLGQCGGVIENFNNTGGSTAQFTGTTPAGGSFGLNSNQLRFTVPNNGGSFTLLTRTFNLPNGASTIDYGFALATGNTASISGTTVAVKYVNTSGAIVTSSPATIVTGGSLGTGNSTNICSTVAIPTDMSTTNRSYQLVFAFTADGNGNPNSYFTIDDYRTSSSFAGAALPVKFQNFEANPSGSSVSLKWVVATEENLAGYEIERSIDGKNFSKIGFVSANNQSSYTFVDNRSSGSVYYRIRSVDLDGKYALSTIVLVKAGQAMIVLNAFPSPFTKSFNLDHGTATSGSVISISGQDGRVIKTIIPTIGSQRTPVDLSAANAGMYLVRYKNGNGEVETLKILKQ